MFEPDMNFQEKSESDLFKVAYKLLHQNGFISTTLRPITAKRQGWFLRFPTRKTKLSGLVFFLSHYVGFHFAHDVPHAWAWQQDQIQRRSFKTFTILTETISRTDKSLKTKINKSGWKTVFINMLIRCQSNNLSVVQRIGLMQLQKSSKATMTM